jgi:hypothetical protein
MQGQKEKERESRQRSTFSENKTALPKIATELLKCKKQRVKLN